MTEPIKVSFLVCGAQKAGTSFLFELCKMNPEINVGNKQETNYFNFHLGRGPDWYHSHFKTGKLNGLIGEVNANYMMEPEILSKEIFNYNPDAKLIFILRHPIQRAWSHYWHNREKGREPLSFVPALEKEMERIQKSKKNFYRYSYALRSRYYQALEPFYGIFHSSRIHVLLFENLLGNPQTEWDAILKFLELPPQKLGDTEKINKNPSGIPFYQSAQNFLYGYKFIFRNLKLMPLWIYCIRKNLEWGRPKPKMSKEEEETFLPLIQEDVMRLYSFFKMKEDFWKIFETP